MRKFILIGQITNTLPLTSCNAGLQSIESREDTINENMTGILLEESKNYKK